jgi:hypothetical protein
VGQVVTATCAFLDCESIDLTLFSPLIDLVEELARVVARLALLHLPTVSRYLHEPTLRVGILMVLGVSDGLQHQVGVPGMNYLH